MGAMPATVRAVRRLAIHHPRNVRRVTGGELVSAIRPEF
jgi:hypothetical protein